MGNTVRSAALVALVLAAAGCATTGEPGGRAEPGAANPEIVSMNRAIGKEQDAAALASLLFKRGHLYLVDAELLHGPSREANSRPGSFELPSLLLGAIQGFEDIAANFPQSAEAPEALFHLGLIYDYPKLVRTKVLGLPSLLLLTRKCRFKSVEIVFRHFYGSGADTIRCDIGHVLVPTIKNLIHHGKNIPASEYSELKCMTNTDLR